MELKMKFDQFYSRVGFVRGADPLSTFSFDFLRFCIGLTDCNEFFLLSIPGKFRRKKLEFCFLLSFKKTNHFVFWIIGPRIREPSSLVKSITAWFVSRSNDWISKLWKIERRSLRIEFVNMQVGAKKTFNLREYES